MRHARGAGDHTENTFRRKKPFVGSVACLRPGTVAAETREADPAVAVATLMRFTAARACGVYEGALRASVLLLKRRTARRSQSCVDELGKTQRALSLRWRHANCSGAATSREREGPRLQSGDADRPASCPGHVWLPLDEISLARDKLITARHRAGMDAKGRRETVADAFPRRPSRRWSQASECCLSTTSSQPGRPPLPAHSVLLDGGSRLQVFMCLQLRGRCAINFKKSDRLRPDRSSPSLAPSSGCCEASLHLSEVYATLRPPATFLAALRVAERGFL